MKNQQNNPLMDFYNQLPPELQKKIQLLPPEKQQEVLMQLMQKYQEQNQIQQFSEGGKVDPQQIMQIVAQALQQGMQPEEVVQMLVEQGIPQEQAMQIIQQVIQSTQQPEQEQQFAIGGQAQSIPVEAERNENITVQNGQQPQVEGGYLEQQSYNPVTGQATYEIPDNEHNETHDNGGVNMELSEGDVVNSDKTKIPIDFKIYGKSFKNKTFKDASDYLSKQETKIQDDFSKKVKEGKTDKVSDGALQIMLAKLGKNRDELNELQEQVLESKKQKETNEVLKSGLAEYGKIVLEINKAEHGFNSSLDRYINYKVTDRPVLKAAEGLNASLEKFSKFADKVTSNPNSSLQDIMSAYKQSGLNFNTKDNTAYYKPTFQPINGSKAIGDFKSKIAQKETGSYKNPYIAIAGIGEKEASTHSFEELKSKAASSGLGKYQFIWNIHKNDIKRVTGVSKPDDFRYNPQAQEQFMDWFRDTQLLPQATELKQKYNIPLSVEQLMAMVHLEGKGGLEKKIKAGTLKTSTMAKNFKNASPLDYASNFRDGGKIYAEKGYTPTYKENSPESKKYFNEIVNYYKNQFPIEELRFKGSDTPTPLEMQQYVTNTFGKEAISDFMKNVPNTNKGIQNYNTTETSNLTTDQAVDAFQDGKFAYRFPIFSVAPDATSLEENRFISNANNDYSFGKLKDNKFKLDGDTSPQGYTYYIPELPKFKISNQANDYEGVNTKVTDINSNKVVSNWNFNPDNKPSNILQNILEDNIRPVDDVNIETNSTYSEQENPTTQEDKTSWMDKLTYGLRESLPYLRNIALMREKQFNPVLQQKPYDNPYDNMRTDYNIQSNLNENQRALLTQMGDTRGNPSVRNARMAQIVANMQNNNNQLYTQKYNQELALENQKTMGQSQYRGQLDDINRGLKKQFEHEVLQTREVARQQKNMAIDNMMNDYLRKQEEKQAIDLSLLNTNYDWNPYTGKYEFNKEKATQNFAEKKFLAKNSSSSGNSKIIEGADGESYEVITPKSGKAIIRKIEKKYGGKVIKY